MYVNCEGDDEHTPPPIPIPGWTGELETRLRLESQVIFFFLLYFTNNFLQLVYMYVDCDGDEEHTPSPIPHLDEQKDSRRLRLESQVSFFKFLFFPFFFALLTIFLDYMYLTAELRWRRRTHTTTTRQTIRGARDASASRDICTFFFLNFPVY